MFNIYSIFAGWMPISFGERKVDTIDMHPDAPIDPAATGRDIFWLSYINYVKDDLDNIFNLDIGEKKKCEFDLEGEDIEINTELTSDGKEIKISIQYLYVDEPESFEYVFDYKEFLKDYVEEFEANKKAFIKDFHYDEKYKNWNNIDWKNIKEKIKE